MLDDESTEDDNAYILRHIDGCYRCYDNFDVENAIREVVKQKSNNVKIPDEVVNEIREKIEVH
jgi:anti-sigma factor (TIGR02949 family)